jgi:DNA-binding CsgD family transcriptional regulator/tetratricopeptide (TPR) repeat protein
VFVGRERELAAVARLSAEAKRAGAGVTVLITGEAGVGKTRFQEEVASRAAAAGWTVIQGSCDEFGAEARPLAPLLDMAPAIERALRELAPGELEGPAWRAIAGLYDGGPRGTDAGASVVQLCEGLFRRMAAERPLVAIFDDLHWADQSSLALFAGLARTLRSSGAVLVAGYRDQEIGPGHALRPLLAALHRNAGPAELHLAPFGREEAAQASKGIAADLTEGELSALFQRSGGNAFLLEELLASPLSSLPSAVADVVLARIDEMGADAAGVAQAVSLDTRVSRDVLAEVAALPAPRFAHALDELTSRGVLVARDDGYSFRHPLMREVVAARIPGGSAPAMHARMAEALERHGPDQVGALARHWHEAGDREKALVASIEAGNRAFYMGAYSEGAVLLERALTLWEEVSDPEEITGRRYEGLVRLLAIVLQGCGQNSRSNEVLARALDHPERCNSGETASLFWLLGSGGYWTDQDPAMYRLRLPYLRRAIEVLHSEKEAIAPGVRGLVLSLIAFELLQCHGLDDEARRLIEEAEPLVLQATATSREMAESGMAVGRYALAAATAWHAVASGAGDCAERIRAQDALAFMPDHRMTAIWLRWLSGEHAQAIEHGQPAVEWLFEHGHGSNGGAQAEFGVVRSLARLGRWQASLERLRLLRGRLGEKWLEDAPHIVSEGWGPVLVRTGGHEEARHWTSLARRHYDAGWHDFGSYWLTCIELARLDANWDAARQYVDTALDATCGHHLAMFGETVAVGVAILADQAFAAGAAAPQMLEATGSWIARLEACLAEAPGRAVIEDLGMFIEQACLEWARLSGRDDAAAWEDLAERWEALARPYHAAYARFRVAFALLTTPTASRKVARQRARQHLDAALATCREIGAVLLEDEVLRLQRNAGIRAGRVCAPEAPARQAVPGPALTVREMDVLELLAGGASNGQIALRLGISRSTASVHISNILGKLGAANRVEAVVRAGRLGLVQGT